LVTVPVSVTGRQGNIVPRLGQKDFHIFENGVEQDIAYFASAEDPFTVALLLDTSGSTRFRIEYIRDAAVEFINQLRPIDRVAVIAFDQDVQILCEPTNDRSVLMGAINRIRAGTGTSLYDAVDTAISKVLSRFSSRKAIVLITDGVDTSSRDATYESNIATVRGFDALIYPLQYNTREDMDRFAQRRPIAERVKNEIIRDYVRADEFLRELARETGTPFHPADDLLYMKRAVALIAQELRQQYSIGYYPKKKPKLGERVQMRVSVNLEQMLAHSRDGYVFGESPTNVAKQTRNSSEQKKENDDSKKEETETNVNAISLLRRTSEVVPLSNAPTGSRWVCKGPNIPPGFVVGGVGFSDRCPASERKEDPNNMWLVRKPSGSDTVCKGFLMSNGKLYEGGQVPISYVITGHVEAKICGPVTQYERAPLWL
jgi:VWFA-related protein